ncbi:MAG: flagellar basal body-associated FliL family protein [Treponema sp.]|nr:flagellar basal body-associated FliL family protein [Treponema sp.]
MKREITTPKKPSKGLLAVYRVAVTLVLVLIGVLVAGSLYAIVRPADAGPLFYIGRQDGGGHGIHGGGFGRQADGDPADIFSGIGRLRIPLAGQPPATVVLSVSFPYPADDQSFAEELATRIGDFRSITIEYFSALSREEIAGLDETVITNEILARYNALLRLGRIRELYFTDLIIID